MTYGTFLSYVVPAVLAMALSGVYALVDGFFVGNRIGDPGLSAINFAYPVTAFLEAVGTGIGMGGAVHYALSMGRGRRELARQYGAAALWGLLAAGAVLSLVLWLTAEPMLYAIPRYTAVILRWRSMRWSPIPFASSIWRSTAWARAVSPS